MSVVLKKPRIKWQGENWQTLVAIGRGAPPFYQKTYIALNIKLAFLLKKCYKQSCLVLMMYVLRNINLLRALKNYLKYVTSILKNYCVIQK